MIAALLLLALIGPQQGQDPAKPPKGTAPTYATLSIPSIEDPSLSYVQWIRLAAMDAPQRAPRHDWAFPFVAADYMKTDAASHTSEIRFQVFSQYRNETLDNDPAVWTTRLLMRLWDMNFHRMGIDNPLKYHNLVDVFLCTDGDPGGQQMFVNEDLGTPEDPKPTDMNAVFIYQVQTMTDPGEFVREVAHEFGHASLPQVGPFKGPEAWANGDVGERIYIKWLDDAVHAGKLAPLDVAKATAKDLDKYLAEKVDPLVRRTAATGPDLALLAADSEAAFYAYVSLAVYSQAVLPARVLGRAMLLAPGNLGKDFATAVVDACNEQPSLDFTVPAVVGKGPLWLPVGKGTVTNGSVLARRGAWAKVSHTGGLVHVKFPSGKTSQGT